MPTEQVRNASQEAINSFANELDTIRERVTKDLKVAQALDFARRMGELHLQALTAVQLVDLTLEDPMAMRYMRSRERARKALLTWAERWDRAKDPNRPRPITDKVNAETVTAKVRELDSGVGAPWERLLEWAGSEEALGLAVDEAVNRGLIYEPRLGVLKVSV